MRSALAFLTPFGGAHAPSPAAVRWFPVVGVVIGAGVGAVWVGASHLWPVSVAAALALLADLVLTGMLHLDGLVDSADGLLPHLDRDRRLEVMADPTVGAFGVVVAIAVVLTRWVALATTHPDVWLIAGLWCLSRAAMAAVMSVLPYARSRGLATAFQGESLLTTTIGGLAVAVVLVTAAIGAPAFAVVAASCLGVVGVGALARARIGGYTGDVLGAAGVLAETIGLLVAAAKW